MMISNPLFATGPAKNGVGPFSFATPKPVICTRYTYDTIIDALRDVMRAAGCTRAASAPHALLCQGPQFLRQQAIGGARELSGLLRAVVSGKKRY